MFGILEAVAVPETGAWSTYEELIADLNDRMSKDGYKVVKSRSHRSRIGGAAVPGNMMIRADLVCDRGGRPYECKATKHKTSTKKTGCPWNAKAVYRKAINGWVLTITCDQHNHEPGTPEPPTPSAHSEDEEVVEEEAEEGPRPDPETAAAIDVAGVSETVLRLSGDTFHQFKTDYRKMAQHDRMGMLAQLQLRIAAIYAVQNEDLQRQRRKEAQEKRHREIEESRQQLVMQRARVRKAQPKQVNRQQAGQQQNQSATPQTHPQDSPQQLAQQAQRVQQGQNIQQQSSQPQPRVHSVQHPSPFTMAHSTDIIFPVPGFDIADPPAYPGPPKRIRGQQPLQSQDTEDVAGAEAPLV
ncbi:hypothetical protein S7711_01719 [Stachybotrys chartarum IBT 7711]|uniref:FAR1 domain-containing protein n=1 Tax=Stachybotrys chartarum (strain CBS 109288 / IBT 7711) TaxID=1280523 RepID=A0A084AVD9_STACB|nr:hypothetical protein S7711_01719 [Stachybotrys chartarum IBT 7711]KFA46040.1 hypothetical protein S40293_07477 [Stachybotrys chartarum IBT 40293]